MKRLAATVVCVAAIAAVCSQQAARAQNDQGQPAPATAFAPGLDDLMTMLVQPRHQRLYLAGMRKNWELAAFQAGELRSSLRRIGDLYPRYTGLDFPKAVTTFLTPALNEMDAAITSASPARFQAAFRRVTEACNECHTYAEHPYLLIKVPDVNAADPFPDQVFEPSTR